MRNLPGRTLALIGVLIVIALILIGLAIRNSQINYKLPQTAQNSPTPTIEKTASVSFNPPSLDATIATNTSQIVDIVADTGGKDATGVQIDISYDPKLITGVSILPPNQTNSLFGAVGTYATLFNTTKPQEGSAFYAVAINPGGKPVTGAGSVGRLQFSILRGSVASTQITFGPRTLVTRAGIIDSVLNSTTPLTIKVQ